MNRHHKPNATRCTKSGRLLLCIRISPAICSSVTALQNLALIPNNTGNKDNTVLIIPASTIIISRERVQDAAYNYTTYWMDTSVKVSSSPTSFFFFRCCFIFCFPLPIGWLERTDLNDWYQSYRLIRSPCSWDKKYLPTQMNRFRLNYTVWYVSWSIWSSHKNQHQVCNMHLDYNKKLSFFVIMWNSTYMIAVSGMDGDGVVSFFLQQLQRRTLWNPNISTWICLRGSPAKAFNFFK